MATDRWNRLRACTGGLGMSMRMASSSSSSHCRATLGPWSRSRFPSAAEVAGSDITSITRIVRDALGPNRTIKTLPDDLFPVARSSRSKIVARLQQPSLVFELQQRVAERVRHHHAPPLGGHEDLVFEL